MCIIALAPEIGVAMAVEQFMTARKMTKKFQDLHFTMTHGFYALMGGFVIAVPYSRDNNLKDNKNSTSNTTPSSEHQMSSENEVEIYCLECKDFGKCFTIFLLLLHCSSRPVHLLASAPFTYICA
jgi:hypothetical protein